MKDKEIIERILAEETRQREEFQKAIDDMEFVIKKRVNEDDFNIMPFVLNREILIAKRDCHYSLEGYIEILREKIDE